MISMLAFILVNILKCTYLIECYRISVYIGTKILKVRAKTCKI